jgi:L-lactate dehydrogenase (cytochrome)
VKALALGADAVSMGRPYLYALGAAGERGVDQLLAFMREGMERTMALTGVRTIAEIDRSLVARKRADARSVLLASGSGPDDQESGG